jgi:hypothetical protein
MRYVLQAASLPVELSAKRLQKKCISGIQLVKATTAKKKIQYTTLMTKQVSKTAFLIADKDRQYLKAT